MTGYDRIWLRVKTLAAELAEGALPEHAAEKAFAEAMTSESMECVPPDAVEFYRREMELLRSARLNDTVRIAMSSCGSSKRASEAMRCAGEAESKGSLV